MSETVLDAVKERPILFNGEMVKALLDGRKTQTRRVVKFPANGALIYRPEDSFVDGGNELFPEQYLKVPFRHRDEPDDGCLERLFPRWSIGDRLWVKETFKHVGNLLAIAPKYCRYKTDGECEEVDSPWKPSIFMPRWASRITLEITEVRVQWLQEISEEDAKSEGVHSVRIGFLDGRDGGKNASDSFVEAYGELWDSINGKTHPWASNCWVWVITFRKL